MFDNIVERGQISSNTALFFNANSKKKTKLKYLLYSVTNLRTSVVDPDPDHCCQMAEFPAK
jgi:hypothetical protein